MFSDNEYSDSEDIDDISNDKEMVRLFGLEFIADIKAGKYAGSLQKHTAQIEQERLEKSFTLEGARHKLKNYANKQLDNEFIKSLISTEDGIIKQSGICFINS